MDTKKIIVTLPASLYNYAITQGKNLNDGIINILRGYKDMDACNITSADSVFDMITDTEVQKPQEIKADVLSALDSVTTSIEENAVKLGKVFKETKDSAIIIEYSPYSYAIIGDTKPENRRNIIKQFENVRFVGTLTKYHNASGWIISKKSIADNMNNFISSLEETGLSITIGESVVTEAERIEAKSKEDEKKPTKTIPLAKKEKEVKQIVCIEPPVKDSKNEYQKTKRSLKKLSENLYYNYDEEAGGSRIYIYVGEYSPREGTPEDVFYLIGKVKGDASSVILPNKKKYDYIIQHGILEAYKDNIISKIPSHVVWAYAEIGDEEYVNKIIAA